LSKPRDVFLAIVMVLLAGPLGAGEVEWWVTDTADELMRGNGDGVAVTTDGRLVAVPRWQLSLTLEEPVVLAADRLPDGDLVVVTGHPARLYRVEGRTAELLAELPGEQATSVLVTADGAVWVTTVAPGVLVRWSEAGLEEVGRLGTGGFWSLTELGGVVIAGAGPPAALFRVTDAGLERWLELPDDFVRSLTTTGTTLLAGTSGEGLIVRVAPSGRPALVVDSPFTEISDIVVDGEGVVWATALVGEPAAPPKPAKADAADDGETSSATVTAAVDLDLPKIDGKTATSELVRVTPEGALLHVHRFAKQVAAALAVDGDGILVGTGYEGEVWRFVGDNGARLASVDAVQVTGLTDDGTVALTQGPAGVYERRSDPGRPSRFRSVAKEFERPVRFGRYRLLADADGARIRFRTGAGGSPDPLWLPWTELFEGSDGDTGVDLGRAVQWEVELPDGATIERVEVAYKEINQAPVVRAVTVEDPGVVYLATPPPPGPVIYQEHPTFEGVFTTLGANARSSSNGGKGKRYYQVGYRTVAWAVDDPNDDRLLFDLEVERSDGFTMTVRKRLEEEQLAVDTTALPDGRYRFRVTASDMPENPAASLEGGGVSRWIRVDNTPPAVQVTRDAGVWVVAVEDESPLTRVEMARDGERWTALEPLDGVLDGPRERFRFAAEEGRHLVVVRAFDRFHNRSVTGVEEGAKR
jgi:hypothetical protein